MSPPPLKLIKSKQLASQQPILIFFHNQCPVRGRRLNEIPERILEKDRFPVLISLQTLISAAKESL